MENGRIHILVTGFGPFPHVPVNPTQLLARALAADRRSARLDIKVSAHVFATRWSVLDHELESVLAHFRPDAVLHLGVAARRKFIGIETMARLGARRLLPDASGRQEKASRRKKRPSLLRIAAPAQRLQTAIARAGAPAKLSNNAGRYLCNGLYAQSLLLRKNNAERRPTLFIHVPMPAKKPGTVPIARARTSRLSAAMMAKALSATIPVLALAARQSVRA